MAERAFKKILVANRGEIAVRIIRACKEMGISAVAVYSEVDRTSLHVRTADEAYPIGPAPSRDSYLRIDRLLETAQSCGADAIHPGYGFLAENADFARACEDAGLSFIGPRSETVALMGEKTSARRAANEAGVPVVPGSLASLADPDALGREAIRVGFPVMLKAAAGGGGKGMRLLRDLSELGQAAERARSEAFSAFGDERLYIEKAIECPRHIEIQVLADHHGAAVHLFERECSLQRRHQKIIEESPSPFVTPELRARMGGMAMALLKQAGYRNAGTVEFLVDGSGEPYFLEMNTRLQVEHPVTEMVTGEDLVKLQIRIAQGEPLPFAQKDLSQRGHALECRIYAEDPERGFLPSPGRITSLRSPGGPGIREDSGFCEGDEVPIHYDPLISKLLSHGRTREEALARMRRAISEYTLLGIKTTLPLFSRILRHPDFVAGKFDTSFVDRILAETWEIPEEPREIVASVAAIRAFRDRLSARLEEGCDRESASAWRRAGWREAARGEP